MIEYKHICEDCATPINLPEFKKVSDDRCKACIINNHVYFSLPLLAGDRAREEYHRKYDDNGNERVIL